MFLTRVTKGIPLLVFGQEESLELRHKQTSVPNRLKERNVVNHKVETGKRKMDLCKSILGICSIQTLSFFRNSARKKTH